MKKTMKLLLILTVTALASGCASPEMETPKDKNESMIFGYVDTQEAPGVFWGAAIKQIIPVSDEEYPPYSYIINNHIFFLNRGVPPGVFKMDALQTASGNTRNMYSFPKSERSGMDVKITKPGMYFVGAWKLKVVPIGFWKAAMGGDGKFYMERLNSPSELEVLNQILPYAKDQYWIDMINNRIRQLRK